MLKGPYFFEGSSSRKHGPFYKVRVLGDTGSEGEMVLFEFPSKGP